MTRKTRPSPASRGPEPEALRKTIFIVDDHPLFREGISQLIDREPDLIVCGGADSGPKALSAIEQLHPDLLIVDISIHGSNGIELVKTIKAVSPGLPILMLSMHDETLYAERALRAGARGYVMKNATPSTVLSAVRTVLEGGTHLSSSMERLLLDTFISGRGRGAGESRVNLLSDRELEVFQAIGEGKGTREIAFDLGLSIKTVESHRAHIKEKLEFRSAPELARAAVEWVISRGNG